MTTRASEIALLAILVVIVGFTRVYYGGPDGLMVVWKGDFDFRDTLVNLPEFYEIPRDVAIREHPNVLYQLEEMGLIDGEDDIPRKRLPPKTEKSSQPGQTQAQPEKTAQPPANH